MNKLFSIIKANFNLYNLLLFVIFTLAVVLRLKVYLANPSMWHDECALAWSVLHKNYSQYFGVLEFFQVAPPFFMIISKFITQLFGASDFTIRILPITAGILSLPLFYLVLKNGFKQKATVILALFLFAINQQLINYSFEFKQYGADVFCTLAALLFFQRLNIEKITLKKALASSIGLGLLLWLSFVSMFVVAGGLSVLFLSDFKKHLTKKFVLTGPVLLSLLVYFLVYILKTRSDFVIADYWADKFIRADFSNFLYLMIENIKYFFFPIKMVLFEVILLVWGIVAGVRDKNKTVLITSLAFLFVIMSSILKIYPFSERLILFILPPFLIVSLIPFDNISLNRKFKSFVIVLITTLAFYVQIPALISFIKLSNFNRGEYPHEMMEYMVKNLNANDVIFVNKASAIEFDYYSSYYSIKNKVIKEQIEDGNSEKYIEFLNGLPDGSYWFYLPYDSSHNQVFPHLLPWIQSKQIINAQPAGKSVLVYLKLN